jgi:ABC-2 type transport system ATP-binding protein
MSTLEHSNYTKFKIEMREPIPPNYFDLDGISNLLVNEKAVNFIFSGDVNKILEKLYERKVNNLIVEEPSLEEIFMHFYEKEA